MKAITDKALDDGIKYLTKKDWLIFDSHHPARVASIRRQLIEFIRIVTEGRKP